MPPNGIAEFFRESPVIAVGALAIALVVLFGVMYFVKEVIRHLVRIAFIVLIILAAAYVVWDRERVFGAVADFFGAIAARFWN